MIRRFSSPSEFIHYNEDDLDPLVIEIIETLIEENEFLNGICGFRSKQEEASRDQVLLAKQLLGELCGWANANLSEEKLKEFDDIVDKSDFEE